MRTVNVIPRLLPLLARGPALRGRCGVVLAILLAALRFPWMDCDAGTASLWDYGTFLTDEGIYTCGGKTFHLTGSFFDTELNSPDSFLVSWGMHHLAALGYGVFGLTWGASRAPVMLLAVAGWLAAFALLSRRSPPVLSAALVALVSCNPVSLMYERMASTDVAAGALFILGVACATSRRVSARAASGLCLAMAWSVKQTVTGLLPLLLLALLPAARRRPRDLPLVALSIGLGLAGVYGMREAALWRASVVAGASLDLETLSRIPALAGTSMGLHQVSSALGIFPKFPVGHFLGMLFPWLFTLPVLVMAVARRRDWWIGPELGIAAGVLIYELALASQSQTPLRYFVEAIYYAPLLLARARVACPRTEVSWRALGAALLLAGGVTWAIYWRSPALVPVTARDLYEVYVLPLRHPLKVLWPLHALGGPALFVLGLLLTRGLSVGRRLLVAGALCAGCLPLLLANYSQVHLFPRHVELGWNQGLSQFMVLAVGLGFLGGRLLRPGWMWHAAQAGLFLLCCGANLRWTQAYGELASFQFHQCEVGMKLQDALPTNAIVLGRQSHSLLRHSWHRAGLVNPDYTPAEFSRKLVEILRANPRSPVFLALERTGSHQRKLFLGRPDPRLVATPELMVMMPSDLDGAMLDPVIFYRLGIKDPSPVPSAGVSRSGEKRPPTRP